MVDGDGDVGIGYADDAALDHTLGVSASVRIVLTAPFLDQPIVTIEVDRTGQIMML